VRLMVVQLYYWLASCVPACTCVSSVPVPDADALDMDIHVRA